MNGATNVVFIDFVCPVVKDAERHLFLAHANLISAQITIGTVVTSLANTIREYATRGRNVLISINSAHASP